MTYVLDASVVVKWFKEELPREHTEVALGIYDQIAAFQADACWAPPIHGEVLNILHRARFEPDVIGRSLTELQDLELIQWTLEPDLARRTAEISHKYGLSTYDAQYVAVAEEVQGVWVTFDRKAHDQVAELGLSMVPGSD